MVKKKDSKARKELERIPQKSLAKRSLTDIFTDPELDKERKIYFFTYWDKEKNELIRVEEKRKSDIYNTHQRIREEIKQKKKDFLKKEKKKGPHITAKSKEKSKNNKKEIVSIKNVNERRTEILSLKLQGYLDNEIQGLILEKYNIDLFQFLKDIDEVTNFFQKIAIQDLEQITIVHTKRYESLFRKFSELDSDKLAMKALIASEKLHGFHNESVNVQINEFFGADKKQEYDINNLSKAERSIFLSLMKKVEVKE